MDLTFENWLSGEVELVQTYKNITPNKETADFDKIEHFTTSIDLFPKKEKTKIKAYQKKYFNELSVKIFNKLYNNFKIRHDSSDHPLKVLETELFFLDQILYGEWAEDVLGVYINRGTNIIILGNSYSNFENYISKIKKRNLEPYFDFMPSPNSKFYDLQKSIIPELYADVIFKLKIKLSRQHPNPDEISLIPKEFIQEPKNNFPLIFSNGWAYKTYKIIEEIIAVNNKTYNADYALIYDCLHNPEIQAILKNVDKDTFSDFVNSKSNGDIFIAPESMRKSTSLDKNRAIRYGLKLYLKSMNHEKDEIKKILTKVTL